MSIMLQALGTILGILFVAVIAWATVNFTKWTGIQLTEQQRAIINEAAEAIAGALKLMLAQGKMRLTDVHPDNPDVISLAANHITENVAGALAAHKENTADLIRKAVAIVGHGDACAAAALKP